MKKKCSICEEAYTPFREVENKEAIDICQDCFRVLSQIAEFFRQEEGQDLTPAYWRKGGQHFVAGNIFLNTKNPVWKASAELAEWFAQFYVPYKELTSGVDIKIVLLDQEGLEKIHYSL